METDVFPISHRAARFDPSAAVFSPQLARRMGHLQQEALMSRLYPLLAKFGLFARKPRPETDMFELRLLRIGSREARARHLGPGFRARA